MSRIPELARIRDLIDSLPGDVVVLWAPQKVGFEIECSRETDLAQAIGLMEVAKAHLLKALVP